MNGELKMAVVLRAGSVALLRGSACWREPDHRRVFGVLFHDLTPWAALTMANITLQVLACGVWHTLNSNSRTSCLYCRKFARN